MIKRRPASLRRNLGELSQGQHAGVMVWGRGGWMAAFHVSSRTWSCESLPGDFGGMKPVELKASWRGAETWHNMAGSESLKRDQGSH